MSEAESPACDLVVWNSLNNHQKETALLGESYLYCLGCVPQELNHRPAYACFSPWPDTSRWRERGESTWQIPKLLGDECMLLFQIQPRGKGSNQFFARKPKGNLEGKESEPLLYITMDYNWDISPPSLVIDFWGFMVYTWYTMQSMLPQLIVHPVLTAKGKILVAVRVHVPGSSPWCFQPAECKQDDCTSALRSFLLFLEHWLSLTVGPLESLLGWFTLPCLLAKLQVHSKLLILLTV